jgi:hypothetical protein
MDTKELQEKLVLFLDPIGRVLIGEKEEDRSTDDKLVVSNPVIIHVEPKDGNISIQFFPILFREFLGSRDEKGTFTYNTSNIGVMDKTVFDFKLYAQYSQMFSDNSSQNTKQTQSGVLDGDNSAPETIKLFDE